MSEPVYAWNLSAIGRKDFSRFSTILLDLLVFTNDFLNFRNCVIIGHRGLPPRFPIDGFLVSNSCLETQKLPELCHHWSSAGSFLREMIFLPDFPSMGFLWATVAQQLSESLPKSRWSSPPTAGESAHSQVLRLTCSWKSKWVGEPD